VISLENVWSFENGYRGILDFSVVAGCAEESPGNRISARAVEGADGEINILHEDRLLSFLSAYSDNASETLEWLRRMLGWHLDYFRAPALAIA